MNILVALLVLPTAAAAQEIPTLTLTPGEAVTVRFDDGGQAGEPGRGPAEWSRFDRFAAQQLAGMTPPEEPLREGIPVTTAPEEPSPDPIPPSEVRFRFLALAGRHTILAVENGRERALTYRARITANGETRHTDVCVVLPRLPSYEHWAYAIDRIELSNFRFISWPDGRIPTCE